MCRIRSSTRQRGNAGRAMGMRSGVLKVDGRLWPLIGDYRLVRFYRVRHDELGERRRSASKRILNFTHHIGKSASKYAAINRCWSGLRLWLLHRYSHPSRELSPSPGPAQRQAKREWACMFTAALSLASVRPMLSIGFWQGAVLPSTTPASTPLTLRPCPRDPVASIKRGNVMGMAAAVCLLPMGAISMTCQQPQDQRSGAGMVYAARSPWCRTGNDALLIRAPLSF